MQVDSDKIFLEILEELRSMNKTNKEILRHEKDNRQALKQMAQYLTDYQSVIEFQIKDNERKNQDIMRELKVQVTRIAAIVDPELTGGYRANSFPISTINNPVYTLNQDVLLEYAENSLSIANIYNCAYYRVGYYGALGTTFSPINEGVPNLMGRLRL